MSQRCSTLPQSPEMVSPVDSNDSREVSLEVTLVAPQWQRLASMDGKSPHFLPLLSFLTSQGNRSLTTNLRGTEASIALNAMDQLLRDGKLQNGHDKSTLLIMRRLAYNSGQVPASYQVDRNSLSMKPAVIANGSFAEVRKGKLKDKVVAIRTLRIDPKHGGGDSQKLFCKESILWMNVSHPNLLKLISVDIDTQTGQCSMISEMMLNGNIREYIRKNSTNRHRLLGQAAAGLSFLHCRDIVHGDLKGHNILITNEDPPQACLADFGLSAFAPGTEGATNTATAGGTPLYMAPELLLPEKFGGTGRPAKPTDIYAFGMVIFEVLSGRQPFDEKRRTYFEIVYRVVGGERPTKPDNAEQMGFGHGMWELAEECWRQESTTRPTVDQVLSQLTRVAAFSIVVGPTPRTPHEDLRESGSPSKTRTSTTITSVPSRGSEHSHPIVESRFESGASPLVTRSLSKLPFRRSDLPAKLLVQQDDILVATIPMPIFSANKPAKSDLFGFHRLLDKFNSRRKSPSGSGTGSLVTSSLSELPFRRSALTTSPRTRIGKMLASTIPIHQQPVLLEWQDLKKSGSIDLQILALLVDVQERRDIALQFKGKEAAIVINAIDKALKQNGGSEKTRLHAFKVLRKLAGDTRQVPKSYRIGKWTSYTVKEGLVASGGFADIREGRLGKRVVAVKTIRMTREIDVGEIHKAFCKESVLWMNISHPNILQLLAVDIKPHVKTFSMISEMMANGHIMTYISVEKADRLGLLKDVADGLSHLHGLGIVHGDLKGPNILINNGTPPQACISDFGLCAIAPWIHFDPTTRRNAGGTVSHFAPELFVRGARHAKETDIYAFGVVVYQVIIGTHFPPSPWAVDVPRPEGPAACGFGQGTWEFVEKCWDKDHKKRPTVEEALEHFERVAVPPTLFDPSPKPCSHGDDKSSGLNFGS